MPRKAFLKKKSLLDRFKDDYATHTGYIQSARAKHTWNNPLTRRKRTKELNRWIKSFAGKNHIHKLARFNATNAGRYESMYNEAMSLKGFLENLTEKLTKQFDLDLEEVQAYLNSHTQEMQELLNDTELSLKEKVLFVRSEITGEQDEKKSEKLVVSNPCVVYKGDAENAAKAHDYLYKKMPRVKGASIASDVKPLGNNKFCRVLFYGNNTGVMDLFGYYSNMYDADFWHNCDADPQGWVNPQTIARYDVATPRQESKESAEYTVHSYNNTDVVHYEDGTPEEWRCKRCGALEGGADGEPFGYYITNSKGKTVISPLCSYCVDNACDILNATHGNIDKALGVSESKDTDEKLGYEKGHKNSKGENAPWVIRSHEDNRVLASFSNKKDAEEHLKRMKQYSKTESRNSEDLETYACFIDFETEADAKKGMEIVKGWHPVRDDTAVVVDGLGEDAANRLWNDWKRKCAKAGLAISDEGEVYKEEPTCFYGNESKQSEASDLSGYTSDIISELDVIWACGEDGAKRLANKYADVIQQNYTDGDLLASETAKFIAEQEHLDESRKKTESKKSEGRLELVDTIVVPKWLWEAFNFGNDYGEDLDEHEQEILAKFEEEYGKQYYLDDRSEEADFRSRNDFDEYGGPCYEVDVYKMS